jgi:hypothetical protein
MYRSWDFQVGEFRLIQAWSGRGILSTSAISFALEKRILLRACVGMQSGAAYVPRAFPVMQLGFQESLLLACWYNTLMFPASIPMNSARQTYSTRFFV